MTLLTALCGGDQLTGFVMAEMTKKTANRNRVNPLQSFVAGVLDAHQVPGNVRDLVQRLRIAQTSESHRRAEVVITDKIAETFATITPRQGGLLVSKFDNLGYKKLGKDTSYVQYTMRLWKDFTEEEVAAVGVPLDPESLQPREFAARFPDAQAILPREMDYTVASANRRAGLTAMIALVAELGGVDILTNTVANELCLGERDVDIDIDILDAFSTWY